MVFPLLCVSCVLSLRIYSRVQGQTVNTQTIRPMARYSTSFLFQPFIFFRVIIPKTITQILLKWLWLRHQQLKNSRAATRNFRIVRSHFGFPTDQLFKSDFDLNSRYESRVRVQLRGVKSENCWTPTCSQCRRSWTKIKIHSGSTHNTMVYSTHTRCAYAMLAVWTRRCQRTRVAIKSKRHLNSVEGPQSWQGNLLWTCGSCRLISSWQSFVDSNQTSLILPLTWANSNGCTESFQSVYLYRYSQ